VKTWLKKRMQYRPGHIEDLMAETEADLPTAVTRPLKIY
jgi:hypothetical protein